ncbi:sigma factor-like helix-turn-helix DNA-binding protein [Mycolicibacterium hodleri]|uniref:sigma factor-like helix-turn-helix DNA-binding protein n=1 Tax=Mycolicibacterium hodleri TaxID=49897 RepID=UPI0027E336CA|nr:sigma factor-like helix-turn-helix DNA-binding protein [Mycolicibacterium hodleri]
MTWPRWTGTLRGMNLPRRSVRSDRLGSTATRLPLAEAMTLLPADEREILFCASSLSWSVERIARDFGLPSDVVKLRLHDALRRLLGHVPTNPPGTP